MGFKRWNCSLVMIVVSVGFLVTCSTPATASSAVSGVVFLDTNKNGQQDPGENGLAGIAVSDDEHIILTGDNGAYALQASADKHFVFVTQPAGYRTLPKFYQRLLEGTGEELKLAQVDFA